MFNFIWITIKAFLNIPSLQEAENSLELTGAKLAEAEALVKKFQNNFEILRKKLESDNLPKYYQERGEDTLAELEEICASQMYSIELMKKEYVSLQFKLANFKDG